MIHEVYFILDPNFGGDLWTLSRKAHVWILQSSGNDAAARAVWERETSTYSPLTGVTTFGDCGGLSETFYAFLGTIDQHHDELWAPAPWSAIHVIGVPLDQTQPERIAAELSVQSVLLEPEGSGFVIKRAI